MGELGAIHEDVRFDGVKARELAGELRSVARVLEEQRGERGRIKVSPRESWRGRYGDEFEGRVGTCTGDAGKLAKSMVTAAGRLDEMARLAQEEQDRRVQAREWEAAQDDGGGGLFGGVPVVGEVVDAVGDAVDTVDDFVTGEDDLPPPPPPVEPPRIPIEVPMMADREVVG
jgi:hypothetical protein